MARTDRAFWDTSAVVPLCVVQPASATVRQLARRYGRIVAWWGTRLEAHRAIVRLRRDAALDSDGSTVAEDRLRLLCRRWSEIAPTDEVRLLAETALDRHELRAADSLQIAAALVWCARRPRRRPFVCFDERLGRAAAAEGFDVLPPSR